MSQPSSEPAVTVGVLKETTPGEQRVAVVPESVPALARAGVRVLVEPGAGAAAWFPDGAYERAGAKVASRDEVIGGAGVLVGVGAPAPELIARLRAGQAVIGLLRPLVRAGAGRPAGQGRGDRDQPGRAAPHREPGPVHGRAHVPGQRGRLQGGAGRGRSLRPVLPDADHRGRDGQPGERPRARRGRGRPAGHGHRPPAGRRGDRLRHPAGDP